MHSSWKPFLYASLLAAGLVAGFFLAGAVSVPTMGKLGGSSSLFSAVKKLVQSEYVDEVATDSLEVIAINTYLEKLDPFSVYIPPEEVKAANEPLEGNFEGIGVEFNLLYDTVIITATIPGGPSEKAGLRGGDKIITVNGEAFAGTGLTNELIFKTLRGPKDSKVKIEVLRRGVNKLLEYEIQRGQIPIHSVETSLMLDEEHGYIKISRFAQNTLEEFRQGLQELKKSNMKALILDLRGNPGGLLPTATELADEFLPEKKLIVYTEGAHQPRDETWSTPGGSYEKGKLIILIDENSASASEVLSGALQDHDRAVIIGQRSFGKGLVQRAIPLSNGAQLRLTIARYYTPSGRCIQKPYTLLRGQQADSILDKNTFRTNNGRAVFDNGGIKPDIELAADTSYLHTLIADLFAKGVYQQFIYEWIPATLKEQKLQFNNAQELALQLQPIHLGWDVAFKELAREKGINASATEWDAVTPFLMKQFKAAAGRQLFREEGYYRALLYADSFIETALKQP